MKLGKAKHSKLITSLGVMTWELVGGPKGEAWYSC